MNRMKLNYSVDVILTLLFLIVAVTGFVMLFVMPSGVPRGRYQEYMGITKATWTLLHNRSAIMMTVFAAIHLVLHKRWIICTTKNIFKKQENECSND
ncbi:DUF4405 domain-containing protein [Methanomethylovorans sp.]|uniref:DUF4405 domain-containing protein n=1 Tax=Methanomethylovorans sp. TaxID=2758717 RepID=UPI003D1378CE